MKKYRNLTFLFLACLIIPFALSVTSCGGGGKKNRNVEFDSINVITKEDTMRVFHDAQRVMDALQSNQIDSALNLLNVSVNDTIRPLDAKLREQLKKQFAIMPVLDYEIVTSRFITRDNCNVTYRYRFMENPTTDPNYPIHTNITIEVKRYGGEDKVILMNHLYVDRNEGTAAEQKTEE